MAPPPVGSLLAVSASNLDVLAAKTHADFVRADAVLEADLVRALCFVSRSGELAGYYESHVAGCLGECHDRFGVASVVPTAEGSPDALIAAADAALSEATRGGRDRVIAHS